MQLGLKLSLARTIALAGEQLQTKLPISVVILTKNEITNIERCIRSVEACDEIVIVDDGSTDGTKEKAAELGARVLENRFLSFAKQRNWSLSFGELRNTWAIMLDADEAATPQFLEEVAQVVAKSPASVVAFKTSRKTMLGAKWLRFADEYPCWIMRVVRVGHAEFADAGHGEAPVPPLDGEIGVIRQPFLHFAFSHGLSQWLNRHIKYAEREAALEVANLEALNWRNLISRDASKRRFVLRGLSRRLPMRPQLRFLYHYLLRGGFLDGREGFIFSLLKSIYESMIIAKRWELQTEEKSPMPVANT